MKKVNGIVTELINKGINSPSVVRVKYEVDGKSYEITETIKLVSKAITLGFLPIGQKKVPKINCTVGSIVTILYNENNPKEAHIEGNDGLMNC